MKITVTVKTVYGETRVYPACETSALLAKLTGNKTLTVEAMKVIKALGYSIDFSQGETVEEIKQAIGG